MNKQGAQAGASAPRPSTGLAVLLTTLVALGPLSTDLYLPSLPTLVRVFATDAARVQLTLSVFLAGFACAQLVYGPLSDRFGRRPVMLGGLLLYFLASLACMLSTTIEMLIGARFVQALGACAGPVIGRAIVRDVWGGPDAARVIAYVSGAMAIAPLLGPTLGGFLTVLFGWRANFGALVLFSGVQALFVLRLLAESNMHKDANAIHPGHMLANYGRLLADRNYVGYLLSMAFSYSALFAFISGSSFVLIGRFGLSPQVYGMSFGLVVLGYICGTMSSGRLVRRFGSDRLLLVGAGIGALAGASMWGLSATGVNSVWAILIPMFFATLATGLVMPNAIGGALAPYAKMAGIASALMGFGQMAIAALVGVAVGHALQEIPLGDAVEAAPLADGVTGSGAALPVAVALCTALAPICFLLFVRPRKE